LKDLEALKTDRDLICATLIVTPSACLDAIRLNPAVQKAYQKVLTGEITKEALKRFVSDLLEEYEVGYVFLHDRILAALLMMPHCEHLSKLRNVLSTYNITTDFPLSGAAARYAIQKSKENKI
jgi:polyhydroxyalkanoate synthesis regulator phasin